MRERARDQVLAVSTIRETVGSERLPHEVEERVAAHVVRSSTPDWLLPLAPAAGFVFLAAAFGAWRLGVARYASTGS